MSNLVFSDMQQRLEAERFDISYRQPKSEVVRVVEVPKVKRVQVRHDAVREQNFFNAGRYVAGDRDRVAVAAHEWLDAELSK